MRRVSRWLGAVAVLAGVVGAVIAIGIASAASSRARHRHAVAHAATSMSAAQIDDIALTQASGDGDAQPTLIQSAESSRQQANLVAGGDIVPGSDPSILIAERGNFTDSNAPVLPGSPEPFGTVLTLVVDIATGQVTDIGLSNDYPNLASLGAVTTNSASAGESADLRRSLRLHG